CSHRATGDRAFHHGRSLRGRNAVRHGSGRVLQIHQTPLWRGAPHIAHGAPASSLRSRRLERNSSRGALLDHHHDARSRWPCNLEAAMTEYTFPSIDRSQRTLIVGLGETGAAAARWLARAGAKLRILDTREAPPGLAGLQKDLASVDVEYALGGQAFSEDVLGDVGSMVLSPRLSPSLEPVRSLVARAFAAGVEVIGEIELFARALADMAEQGYRPAVLAVTGTNGKTTVTAMTRQLVSASGMSVRAAGNIGPAALSA